MRYGLLTASGIVLVSLHLRRGVAMNVATHLARIPADQAAEFRARLARVRQGCTHLASARIVLGCVQHLDVLRCIDCTAIHIATHTYEMEHTCDICSESIHGDNGDTWHIGLIAPVELDRTISIGPGRAIHVDSVTLIGWGACWSCHIAEEFGAAK
jgi:hypothetical protein